MVSPAFASEVVLLCGALLVGSFVTGFAGFGLAAAAGAFLLHAQPPHVVIPLLMLCSVVAQILGLVHLRHAIEWRGSLVFVLGGLAGVPLAVAVFERIGDEAFRKAFGLFLMLYSAYALTNGRPRAVAAELVTLPVGVPIPAPRERGMVPLMVGFGGGFVGGLTAMPSVLVTIWCDLNGHPKERQRGIVQPFILAMQLVALAWMTRSTTYFSADLFWKAAICFPAVVVGTGAGLLLFGRVSNAGFRLGVLAIVLLSGLVLVLR